MIWRIRDRSTFVELRRRGSRIRRGPIIVTHLPGTKGEPPRVAYAIGRHIGGAVARNRLRRRLRSVVVALAAEGRVAPGAYLIGASPEAASSSFGDLRRSLAEAFNALPPRAEGAR